MEIPLSSSIGVPCISECRNNTQDVRRCRQQQGLNSSETQSRDDCGEEVCNGTGEDDGEEHEHHNPHLDVFACEDESVAERLGLSADPIVLAYILF